MSISKEFATRLQTCSEDFKNFITYITALLDDPNISSAKIMLHKKIEKCLITFYINNVKIHLEVEKTKGE